VVIVGGKDNEKWFVQREKEFFSSKYLRDEKNNRTFATV
jgi:hypothetical protein